MHLRRRTVLLCSAWVRRWCISANSDGRWTRVARGASTCTVVRPLRDWCAGIVIDERGVSGETKRVLSLLTSLAG